MLDALLINHFENGDNSPSHETRTSKISIGMFSYWLDVPTVIYLYIQQWDVVVKQPLFETVWGDDPKVCVHHPKHRTKRCFNIDMAKIKSVQSCSLVICWDLLGNLVKIKYC